MGFFDFVKSIGSGFCKTVGKVLRKVGSVLEDTGIPVVKDIGYHIESAGADIESKGYDLAYDIGNSAAYDSSAPSAQQTIDLHKRLSEYYLTVQKDIDPIEEKILKSVEEFFGQLNKIVTENQLGVQTNYLEREQKRTLRNIEGKIKNHISKRISLDDRDCQSILAMNPGQEKKKQIDAFRKRVLQEATKNMWNELEDAFNDLLDDFWKSFDGSLDMQTKQVSKAIPHNEVCLKIRHPQLIK